MDTSAEGSNNISWERPKDKDPTSTSIEEQEFLGWLRTYGAFFHDVHWPSLETESGMRGAIATRNIDSGVSKSVCGAFSNGNSGGMKVQYTRRFYSVVNNIEISCMNQVRSRYARTLLMENWSVLFRTCCSVLSVRRGGSYIREGTYCRKLCMISGEMHIRGEIQVRDSPR